MWDYLQHLSFWDWLAFGSLLLILEVFGAGGYLLWTGIAAAIVGILVYLFPGLDWAWQFLLFGCLSILTAVFWWQRQQAAAKPIAPTPSQAPAPTPVLNDKITKLSPPVVPVPTPVPSTPAASVPVEPVPTEAAPPIRSASAPVPTEEAISTEMLAPVITEPVVQAINSQPYQNHETDYL